MTERRQRMIEMLMKWDREARDRGQIENRKLIWRIIDALQGGPVDPRVKVWLGFIDQTPTVLALREELGMDEAPVWARRAG